MTLYDIFRRRRFIFDYHYIIDSNIKQQKRIGTIKVVLTNILTALNSTAAVV